MRISSQLLLTFLLNAVWQIALIAALASLGAHLLRHSTRYQHWLWVAALCLSLLVPVLTASRALPATSDAPTRTAFQRELTNPVLAGERLSFQSPSTAVSAWSFQLNARLVLTLLVLYGVFVVYGSFRLLRAWFVTRRVREAAVPLVENKTVEVITRDCARRLNLDQIDVRVYSSASLPVPVTAGLFRPVIILPDALLRDGNTDLLTSAIGHEFIHVARRDYLLNLIYELLFLPVSFHPAAALLRRRIKQTRELCCDELVAERILNAQVYARSLVALASSAPPLRRLSVTTTVGIADADILEARIMSLLSKPKMNRRWKKLILVAVSLLLLVPSLAAAAFAMRFELAPEPQNPLTLEQQQQEQELKEKARVDEEISRARGNDPQLREKTLDPRVREELQRKRELEVEMRSIKQAALVRLARITMEQAIQIATSHTPGKVLHASLDADKWEEPGKLAKDGTVFYQVIVGDESGGPATYTVINAVDGTVITSSKEPPRRTRTPFNN
jgi:beta-lactamase regulating signal transducer with metallopeptidase domain/uncharacterized membrane protein YkoI